MSPQQKARAFRDPVIYQKKILCRKLWHKQNEIIRSVAENPLTSVRGSHASGKSHAAAGLPHWWLTRYATGKVFTTAPTLRQVKSFWKDIAVARRGSPLAKQILPEPTTTGMEIGPDRYAIGASSSASVNIQGLHGSAVLIIADEAPGIDTDIWDAIEGIRAGGHVRLLEMGNPVVPSGHFFDSHTRNRAIYNCISISAFDTPNFQRPDGSAITQDELMAMSAEELAYSPFPSLITRAWVRERLTVWGPKHPKYLARVLGEFPSEDPYSVFPLSWIERARRDPTDQEIREANRIGQLQVGIDVAGAGSDETALTARIGGLIIEKHAWADADPRGPVCAILARLRQGSYEPSDLNKHWLQRIGPRPMAVVVVDVVGIGYNFALHVADQGFPVAGFQSGGRAIDPSQFVNQKAEAHWTLRSYMKDGLVSGLTDEETAAQLSTIRYRENSRGLTEIEKKEERNARGIPGSPDRAESLVMAFLRYRPARTTEVLTDLDYRISAI